MCSECGNGWPIHLVILYIFVLQKMSFHYEISGHLNSKNKISINMQNSGLEILLPYVHVAWWLFYGLALAKYPSILNWFINMLKHIVIKIVSLL